MPQSPWTPGPALLRPGVLAASLIPPEFLPLFPLPSPPSLLSSPAPPLLLLLFTLSFSQRNPAPCPLPAPSPNTSTFQD